MNPDSSVSLAIQSSTFTSSQGINFSITQAQPLGPSEDPMTVLMKHVALSALHNSDERYDPPRCSEDTYSTILDTIQYWSQATDHSRPLLWIYGSAGIGKSAIAQTLAETWMAELRLAASFFFSRQVDQCNVKKYLVPTIAYQLTLAIPRVWPLMEQAINRDRGLFRKNLQTQMMELIVRPISSLGTLDSHIIIIDGLDECCLDLPGQMYQKQQHEILQAIALAVHRTSFPLRFLIASCPEPHITNGFHTNPLADVSYSIALDHALHLGANTNSSREGNPPSPNIPPPTRSESATQSGGFSPDSNSNTNTSLQSIKAMLMPAENSQHDAPQVAKPEFRLQKSIQQHNQNNGSSSTQPLSWALTTAEKVQYGSIFRAWDAQHTGYISGHTALEVFGASGLSKDELAKIWALVDVSNRGKLNPAEFHVAMGLIYRRLNGNTLPDTLPPELVPPSGYDNPHQALPEPSNPRPSESPPPVTSNMPTDERKAYLRAEAQRRIEARMIALGVTPTNSSKNVASPPTDAEEKVRIADQEAEERARAREIKVATEGRPIKPLPTPRKPPVAASVLPESTDGTEGYERLRTLSANLWIGQGQLDLATPTRFKGPRRLLKEGALTKVKSGRKIYGILCNDILVLTEESIKALYRMPIPLEDVAGIPGKDKLSFEFKRLDNGESVLVKATSPEERMDWINSIQAAVSSCRQAATPLRSLRG